MKVLPLLLLFSLIFFIGVADAKTIYVSSTGGNSDQKVINDALLEAANNPGSTVFLKSDNGPFIITGQIKIGSNTKLTGDSDTVVKVSEKTTQFFVDGVGVVGQLENAAAKNIEICGFSIDGNCDELPQNFANSGSGDHNAERLIELRGYTNDLGSNIYIHDMRLYDAFSDAIHIYYSNNVFCYNNVISNCQHSSIFYVCCFYSALYNNDIAGITSDCARLDNCQNCKVYKNIFYSYTGDHNNGAYETGQNGLQVGDQGHSHGGGSDKAYHTTNIEVYENTFANCGRTSIWIDAAGKTPSTNLYIHDNHYIGVPVVEREGTPVNSVNITESSGNVSYNNMPSIELSEKVFSSIFDILDVKFTNTGRTEQTAEDLSYSIQETEQGRIAGGIKIIGFKDIVYIDGVPYIPDNNSAIVKYEAVKAPSFSWNNTGVSKIDKDVDIKKENGTMTATLTVKMSWYKLSTNSIGATKKKYKTATAIFSDTVKAPLVLDRPHELTGTLYEYPTYALAYVPSNGLTQVNYEYDEKTVNHIYLLGEQHQDNNGVIYTNFSNVNYWRGDLDHQGQFLYINGTFDPDKLTVTAYTPYENFSVTSFNYTKKDYPTKFFADWLFPSFGLFVILWFGAWYYIRKIFY